MSEAEKYGFGQLLTSARKSAGLSQVELEKLSGVKIAHFENESRLPSFEALSRLCLALGVSADSLMFGDRANETIIRKSMAFDKIVRVCAPEIAEILKLRITP